MWLINSKKPASKIPITEHVMGSRSLDMIIKTKRKLQKVNRYSMWVSLPKQWIRDNDLNFAGAEVLVENHKRTLKITPVKEGQK